MLWFFNTITKLQKLLICTLNSYSSVKYLQWQSTKYCKRIFHHPSIIKIKQKVKLNKKFSFQCNSGATVRKVVKSLPSVKATVGEIPVNVLKNSEICFFKLADCI